MIVKINTWLEGKKSKFSLVGFDKALVICNTASVFHFFFKWEKLYKAINLTNYKRTDIRWITEDKNVVTLF